MIKYFSIKYWRSQIKIGKEHYFRTLKELVPPNLYDLYMGLNKKISLFISPIVLLTILDRMFFFFTRIYRKDLFNHLFIIHVIFWYMGRYYKLLYNSKLETFYCKKLAYTRYY